MSQILTNFWTAQIYICVVGKLKIMVHFYWQLQLEQWNCLNARLAADGSDGNGLQFENLSQRFQVVSACLKKMDIYSRSLISILK